MKKNQIVKYLFSLVFGIVFFVTDSWVMTASDYSSINLSSGLSFRNVPASHGLSQSSVYCMLQDHKGFVWIGTKDGLNRYDGYEFITYKYDQADPNSLSNNEVTCLESDNNEYLWIGTRSGGINRLEFATGRITRFNNLTYDGLVQALVVDSLNNLWAGTSEGLLLFPPDKNGKRNKIRNLSETATFFDYQGNSFDPEQRHVSIKSIAEIEQGQLLIGAEEGLFFYDIGNNSFISVSPKTVDHTVFTDLLVLRGGKEIWAASYEGIVKISKDENGEWERIVTFDTESPEDKRLPVDWVENIVSDHDGNVWAGTRGAGLLRITDDEISARFRYNNQVSTSVPDDLINSLMVDRTGILWVGTESRGIGYTDLNSKSFHVLRPGDNVHSLSGDLVTAIAGDSDRVWAGTASAGIDVFEFRQNNLIKTNNIPKVQIGRGESSPEVMALLADKDNDLWIGSATNSLTLFDRNEEFRSYVVDGFVFALFQDTLENIWFGTWGQGLGYIDKEKGRIDRYHGDETTSLGLSNDKVLSVFQDSRGLLWVGTKGGGVNVCPIEDVISRTGKFVSYRNEPGNSASLSYNDVYEIAEDNRGNIWLATGSGLNKVISPDEKDLRRSAMKGELSFSSYAEKDGLAGGLVLLIEEDDSGNLWLGTNKGISRFDPDEKNFVNYGPNDGLPSGELHVNASYRDDRTGMMYFGGVDGVTVFHPDSLQPNPFPPKIQITSLRLHNRSVYPADNEKDRSILEKNITYTDHLSLDHVNNEISIEFSGLHFSNPENIKYAYRLKGFNESWQQTGSDNRRATYTNLHEGDYVFEVRATNNDESWSSETASLSLTVRPPFWRTLWAYAFYFIVVVFLLLTFRKYSLIGVKQKNRLIIESLERKKDLELTKAKMRFFTNISHEIRTPLTLIHAPLQEILKRNDVSADMRKPLSVMHRNVKRLLNMVDQLLEFRKIDTGHLNPHPVRFNLKDLVYDTVYAFRSLAEQKNIRVEIRGNDEVFVYADEKMITTAIYNILSNAFKYTPTGGEVSVDLIMFTNNHTSERGIIKICDSGPGILESELPLVFQRFSQAGSRDHAYLGGSGIGLSIVKEFVELNDGSVLVYNLEDRGCCFEIRLPVDSSRKEDEGEKQDDVRKDDVRKDDSFITFLNEADIKTTDKDFSEEKEQPLGANVAENNMKKQEKPVLCIVEDDIELAGWLKNVFAKDFATYVFYDGNQAYSELSSIMPDLVICDVMLPGMSGNALCRKTKARIETSHIPVIMLTAKSEDEHVLEGLKTGADSYMTKPFNIDILKAQMDSLIRSREAFRRNFSSGLSLEPSEQPVTPVDEKFLKQLMEITEENMGNPSFDVSELVDQMHMSHSLVLKKVKALTGLSLVEFIRSIRIKRAAQIFSQDKLSVSEVSYMVGFSDPKYFSKCFVKQIGQRPKEYLRMFHDV